MLLSGRVRYSLPPAQAPIHPSRRSSFPLLCCCRNKKPLQYQLL